MDIRQISSRGGGKEFTIYATYDELVEKLGEPEDLSDVTDKVDVEWNVEDRRTRKKLSIWNYKNGKNYLGEEGTSVDQIERWSAGGSEELARKLEIDTD